MSKNLTSLLAFGSYWERKGQFFFNGVTPGKLITFQDMSRSQEQLGNINQTQRGRDRETETERDRERHTDDRQKEWAWNWVGSVVRVENLGEDNWRRRVECDQNILYGILKELIKMLL